MVSPRYYSGAWVQVRGPQLQLAGGHRVKEASHLHYISKESYGLGFTLLPLKKNVEGPWCPQTAFRDVSESTHAGSSGIPSSSRLETARVSMDG